MFLFSTYFLSLLSASFGTTILYVITPQGIVMSADSKQVDSTTGASSQSIKLVLLQDRIAVATAWLTRIADVRVEDRATGRIHAFDYEFETWIRAIEQRLPTNITVTRFAEIIENESAQTFRDFNILVQAGQLRKDESRGDNLVRYYIAGYEDRIPHVYQIEFKIDWERQSVIGPVRTLLHPKDGQDITFGFNAGGVHTAIDQILKREDEAYEKAIQLVPNELGKLLTRQDFTLAEAVQLSRSFIKIEAEANPDKVGLPIRIVTLPWNGIGELAIYE